ncbi:cyclin-like protein interacting with PHO85 [Coemansia sp. RSA 2607]|nr:cyclin-like protein interacting with PHO85 [Coemansia sp. RSA 2607]
MSDITPFHSRTVPDISLCEYLERIAKFVYLQNDSVLSVLVYLDRLTRLHAQRTSLAITPFNIHRLLITAIIVAHKFNSDVFFSNARYAKVGGIPLGEMNQLELELLFLVKFDLKIDCEELQRIGNWVIWCPPEKLFQGVVSGKPICLLDGYYNDQAALSLPNADIIRIQYPTPMIDPTHTDVNGNSNGSVSHLDLDSSITSTSTLAPSSHTGYQPIPSANHSQHNHNQNHYRQQQQQLQYHHQQQQSRTNHSHSTYQNTLISTPSSFGYNNGSSSFTAPPCSSAASTLCQTFGESAMDHIMHEGHWDRNMAGSPVSPDNAQLNGSLDNISISSGSLKRRRRLQSFGDIHASSAHAPHTRQASINKAAAASAAAKTMSDPNHIAPAIDMAGFVSVDNN